MTASRRALMTVIGVLWTERGISYERLCQDYDIDPAMLDFIRVELVDVKGIARDVDGKGLAWIDRETTVVEAVHVPNRMSEASAPFAAAIPEAGEGQRRQLTIMFCDIVGSTSLSTELDPEDMHDVLQKFRDHCEAAISFYAGRTANYMGDGLLAQFGFPHAHEDDAIRAVQAGLEIVSTMDRLNERIGRECVELAVRIGIATGEVVIEDGGLDVTEDASVVGETPNLAARLQDAAEPNQVILNEVSKQLVVGHIELRDLGERSLKGIVDPIPLWQAVGERDPAGALDDLSSDDYLPLVGRQQELLLLQRAWESAQELGGQVAFVRGEAGVGKTRLLRALRELTGSEVRWITLRGSAHQQATALYPVITHLRHTLSNVQKAKAIGPLAALELLMKDARHLDMVEAVPLVAQLLSIPFGDCYSPLEMTSEQRREAVLDVLNEWMASESEKSPLVIAWEDLHWSDPTTFNLMEILIDQMPTLPILLVGTYRSDFDLPISQRAYGTSISISRLEKLEVEKIVDQIADGKPLPREVVDHIIEKSDGVPLFVEELTKTILESDALTPCNDRYEMNAMAVETQIPSTLQDSLMARLDRVPRVKRIAQVGAVLGREFSYDVLSAVAGVAGEDLAKALGHLLENEILYQRGRPPRSRYLFKHALIQDAAYQCLLRRDRRKVHRRVADVLQAEFSDLVTRAPETLAHHLTEAEDLDEASLYWRKAGERASEQSAYYEAIDYFGRALEVLDRLEPTNETIVRQVQMYFQQGAAYFMTKGHGASEVEEAYSRARVLSSEIEDSVDSFPVLSGLWRCFVMRPELETACELGDQLLKVAEQEQSPAQAVVAHCAASINAFYVGDFNSCLHHAEQSCGRYELSQRDAVMFRAGTDPAVLDAAYSSWAYWLLGQPDQAIARTQEMLDHAEITEHPFSQVGADCYAAVTYQMLRDPEQALLYADRAVAVSEKRGFKFWWAYGSVQRGWALTWQDRLKDGIAIMRDGIAQQSAGGAAIKVPFWKGLLSEALLADGAADEALALAGEALDMMDDTGDRFAEAELLRIKAKILHTIGRDMDAADLAFERSLTVANAQDAQAWATRTSLTMLRLLEDRGAKFRAQDVLAQSVGRTQGGLQTYDLRHAAKWLEAENA